MPPSRRRTQAASHLTVAGGPVRYRTDEGPCAACQTIHPHHYGAQSTGPLCPACTAAAVARWSAGLRRVMGVDD